MHITKFGKQLIKQQEYLQTCDIKIDDETKTQFYVEQMIDSAMFDKRGIIAWENADNKSYKKATRFFEKLVDNDETCTSAVGGTAKMAQFENAKNTREERETETAREQRNDVEIGTNERVLEYLDRFTAAATMEGKLREPAQKFDMVPDVTLDSLASTSKMCNAGYFTAFEEGEVQHPIIQSSNHLTIQPFSQIAN